MPINAKIRLKISLIVGSFSPILDQHLHQVELSRRTHKVCALKLTRVCAAVDGFAYILHALFSVANRFFGVALDLLMQSLDLLSLLSIALPAARWTLPTMSLTVPLIWSLFMVNFREGEW